MYITIKKEIELKDFDFWGGAVNAFENLTAEEIEEIEEIINEFYPDGITEMELNDLIWFDWDNLITREDKEDY